MQTRLRGRLLLAAVGVAGAAALLLGSAHDARTASEADTVTITMRAGIIAQPGYDVLIANFERVYPDIDVDITYVATGTLHTQLETTELGAGSGTDILATGVGCGVTTAVCSLGKAGHLAPMIAKPWAKRSLPLVTSLSKYGRALLAFTPIISPEGVWTNDDRFKQLGLKIPQTFPQFLDLCRKAKAASTVALLLPGAEMTTVRFLIVDMAVATVYGKDRTWAAKLRAGKASFSGSPGWRRALQQFVDMNDAGCFQPGASGTTGTSGLAQFARGEGLMYPGITQNKGQIDNENPQFRYSHHPFAGGTEPDQTRTLISVTGSVGVNAHSSAAKQAAAQTFVDFIARPKQNALFAKITGGLTQYQFLKGQMPAFMSDYEAVFREQRYVVNPVLYWWNADVLDALQKNQIGLITGQSSIQDVLKAMDEGWKRGPI